MKNITDIEALERFETIWEHVECGITIVDAETRKILDINPVAAKMFGDDKAKIIGRKCHSFICPAEKCPIMDLNQTVDRSERKFIKADGEIIPIIKSVSKINYNGKPALLESFTDISNIKRAEEKLRKLRLAEQASQAKSDFLSRMSHEIRTPMNAIIGMTKIAESTSDVSKLKYCLSNIAISSQHLLGIINDVLDMSKIESGKFELDKSPFNIEKMLSKICGLIVDMAEQKDIKFSIILEKGLKVNYIGDEMRLSQIITNLLSNAVKFTAARGSIKLTIQTVERTETQSKLRIMVSDTGIGMSKEQVERLFSPFEQADTSISRTYGGTGLGLAISKNLVEKMDGKIWAESIPGKGSSFIFEVRLDHSRMGQRAEIKYAKPEELKVLIIDSDKENIDYFISIAESFGIHADTAATGQEAVEKMAAADVPYNVVFIDRQLEDMDGIEAARRLKSVDNDTVIIMTSFNYWNKIEGIARGAGISRFILKPLLPSSVLDAINELVANTVKAGEMTEGDDSLPDYSDVSILLAEDVDINREIFIALFEGTNLNIDIAENGEIAVEMYKQNPEKYDMILMDVQMPKMDGHSATRTIREIGTENAKNIPIIALTANVFNEDIKRCLDSGMNDHLAKPIDINEVVAKINKYKRRKS